jgi:hypothetical protein
MENPTIEVSTASPLDMSTRPIRVFGGVWDRREGSSDITAAAGERDVHRIDDDVVDATNGMGDV